MDKNPINWIFTQDHPNIPDSVNHNHISDVEYDDTQTFLIEAFRYNTYNDSLIVRERYTLQECTVLNMPYADEEDYYRLRNVAQTGDSELFYKVFNELFSKEETKRTLVKRSEQLV